MRMSFDSQVVKTGKVKFSSEIQSPATTKQTAKRTPQKKKSSKVFFSQGEIVSFYNKLRSNKAIVVPEEDMMDAVCQLQTPVFSIIEEPLVKKKRRRDQASIQEREQGTEITSKIVRMTPLNLMWNINECSIKGLSKKVMKSPALNIRKFKGFHDEKNNEVVAMETPKVQPSKDLGKQESTPALKLNAYKFSDESPENEAFSFQPLPSSPTNKSSRRYSQDQQCIDTFQNNMNNTTGSQGFFKKRLTMRSTDPEWIREQSMYYTRLHHDEYQKLKQSIREQTEKEGEFRVIKDMLQSYDGVLSAKPKFRYLRFLKSYKKKKSRKQEDSAQ